MVTLEGLEASARLTVLAFVATDSEAEAERIAVADVEGQGFTQVRALRAGAVTDEGALPDDFREAMAVARRYGSHLIIYDEA